MEPPLTYIGHYSSMYWDAAYFSTVKNQIDYYGRPMVAYIKWSGPGAHVAGISGYESCGSDCEYQINPGPILW